MSTSVVLVDDHELIREGLRSFLETRPDLTIVGEAASYKQAVEVIESAAPDVAVIDIRLGDGSGIDLCREVRSKVPHTRCLMLTSYSDDEPLYGSIVAGASGYLLKEAKGAEIADAIARVAAGESLLDPAVTAQVLDRLRQEVNQDPAKQLTPQEERVLVMIGDGLTNRQIGEKLGLAEQTVKNYVSVILAKLALERRSQAAALAARRDERRRQRP